MKTEILKIDPQNIDIEKIQFAAKVLRSGGLVVFPTETVYGLGASALNPVALRNIFTAKGRPSDNPLIIHIADKNQISGLVQPPNENALKLMEKFWPGPLTIVLPKIGTVSDIVTAGLQTVAIRMPNHPVALSLINEASVPVAAPSANRSGMPSPTRVEHVIEDLFGLVDVIIDSGPCQVGLESTVVDLTANQPSILRPGGVTFEQLCVVLNNLKIDPGIFIQNENIVAKSPGMKYKHYSPKAKVVIVSGMMDDVVLKIKELSKQSISENKKTGILATDETLDFYANIKSLTVKSYGSKVEKETIAANLFDILRSFDEEDVKIIYAEAIEESGIGMAIMNRMTKAAGFNIINV